MRRRRRPADDEFDTATVRFQVLPGLVQVTHVQSGGFVELPWPDAIRLAETLAVVAARSAERAGVDLDLFNQFVDAARLARQAQEESQ